MKSIFKKAAVILCAAALITGLPFQVDAKPKKLSKNIKVGDTVYFGKYEQDGNKKNGKEQIEWKVIDKKGNKALLISRDILDVQFYNKEYKDITWEKCTIRKWLNKEFLKEAFRSEESKKIEKSKVENKDNIGEYKDHKWHTKGGKNTEDRVFLLSLDEAERYFKSDEKRTAKITKYGLKRLAKKWGKSEKEIKNQWFSTKNDWWWLLRSPGAYPDWAGVVIPNGKVENRGFSVYEENSKLGIGGVRPVIWVNL